MTTTKKLSLSKSREAMNSDLEEIFSYFSLSAEEKSEKFDSIINESMKLSEKIKDKLANGTDSEKKEMEQLLMRMAEKVQSETDRICQDIGVSKEELVAFAQNPDNFSKEEWEAIQEAQNYVKEMEQQNPVKNSAMAETASKRVNMTEWVRS